MANVDPYVVQLPRVMIDPNTGMPTAEMSQWFHYDNRWKQDIWIRTGGGDDLIADAGNTEEASILSDLMDRVEELEARLDQPVDLKRLDDFTIEAGDTAFTTTGDQFITCLNTADATITLNPNPADGEDLIIWRTDAGVVVSGDINGGTSLTINSAYDAPHLKYSLAAEEWAIV